MIYSFCDENPGLLFMLASCLILSYTGTALFDYYTTKTDDYDNNEEDDNNEDYDDENDDNNEEYEYNDNNEEYEDDDNDDNTTQRSIYMIFHETYDGTNVITLDKERIPIIVERLTLKYNDPPSDGEWRYREIMEEEEFEADLDYGSYDNTIKIKMD
jgi:hypothetical protein